MPSFIPQIMQGYTFDHASGHCVGSTMLFQMNDNCLRFIALAGGIAEPNCLQLRRI